MSTVVIPSTPSLTDVVIPPLENGDHLSRAEFNRRWDAMPNLKRAELIEGIVYMGAALRHRQHGSPHRRFTGWLDRYMVNTPGLDGGNAASVGLDEWNEPQPDCYLFLPPALGSKVIETSQGYLEGAPDLVAEIAASSASMDLNQKKTVYERHGVREYIVWRVLESTIDWFILEKGKFVNLAGDTQGILKSLLFPGLWLDTAAMINGPAQRVHEVLDAGLATPEHAAFVAQLAPHVRPETL